MRASKLLHRLHYGCIELRVKTTGYPLKFHSGLKAKLYHINNSKLRENIARLKTNVECRLAEQTVEYEVLGGAHVELSDCCYVVATRIKGEEFYFLKLCWVRPEEKFIDEIKSGTFVPDKDVYAFFGGRVYEKPEMGFLVAAVNNNCRPSAAKLLV